MTQPPPSDVKSTPAPTYRLLTRDEQREIFFGPPVRGGSYEPGQPERMWIPLTGLQTIRLKLKSLNITNDLIAQRIHIDEANRALVEKQLTKEQLELILFVPKLSQ